MTTLRPSCTVGDNRMKFVASDRSCADITITPLDMSRPPGGQDDPAALCPDTPGGRLQEPDHPHPHPPVADRDRPRPDALGEVRHHRLECLPRFDVRAPHVPGPVSHPEASGLLLRP